MISIKKIRADHVIDFAAEELKLMKLFMADFFAQRKRDKVLTNMII